MNALQRVGGLLTPDGAAALARVSGVLVGVSAMPGLPGVSVTAAEVSGGRLLLTLSSGVSLDVGQVLGAPGDDGLGIATAQVSAGRLILTLSDGNTIDAGPVQGAAGVSVTGAAVNGAGNLILGLSNNTAVDAGYVRGGAGAAGVSVTGASINAQGRLILTLSSGPAVDAGVVQGTPGPGVPTGGAAGALLAKTTAADYATGWAAKTGVGTSGSLELTQDDAPATPAAGKIGLYTRGNLGRLVPAWLTPAGEIRPVQASLARVVVSRFNPSGNSSSLPPTDGLQPMTTVGNLTSRAVGTATPALRMRRIGAVGTAATAGTLVEFRAPSQQLTAGSGVLDGSGFYFSMRFMAADAADIAGARMFAGLIAGTGAATNVEPSTITNCIGVAQLSTDATQLYLVSGGSAAQPPVALGTALGPPGGLSTDAYELEIYAPPTPASTYIVRVRHLGTGAVSATLTLSGGAAVVPQSGMQLAHRLWRTNNATALTPAVDLGRIHIETEY